MTNVADSETSQSVLSAEASRLIREAIATYAAECYKINGVEAVYWAVDDALPYFWVTIARNEEKVYQKVFDAQSVIDTKYPSIAVLIDYRVTTIDPSTRNFSSPFTLLPGSDVNGA